MARIRTIKPEFFRHEGLQDLEAANVGKYPMMVFAGLWGNCDKSGVFEWRPRQLKLDVLPFLQFDMQETLEILESAGFIEYYTVDGKEYGVIPSFIEHQRINGKEAQEPAKYPPKPTNEATGKQRGSSGEATEITGREGKGREKEGNGIINPNGLIVASAADDKPAGKASPDCPHQKIIDLYHEVLPMCPQIRAWTPARATQLRARWNEDKSRQNLDYWKRFFEYVATCDFLVGRTSKPFFADLEWMVKTANFTKIREGKYENREAA